MHLTLSDLISDIVQNSIEANSSKITLELEENQAGVKVLIQDNGKGMSKETLEKAQNSFFTDGTKHPKRNFGLGLPLLIQTVKETEGEYKITSELGKGTTVYAFFNLANKNAFQVGEVASLFRQVLSFTGNFDMTIIRKKHTENEQLNYKLEKSEIVKALGCLENAKSLQLLGEFLKNQEKESSIQ